MMNARRDGGGEPGSRILFIPSFLAMIPDNLDRRGLERYGPETRVICHEPVCPMTSHSPGTGPSCLHTPYPKIPRWVRQLFLQFTNKETDSNK